MYIFITLYLIGVSQTTHSTHDTEDIIIGSIDTHLGGLGSLNSGVGEHKLEGGIVDTGEIAGSSGLVLLRAESEGVDVDTSVGVTGMGLVGLDLVEVGSLTLREAVLSVKLKLGGDNRVLSPAMHVQGGLGEHEGSGVRHRGVINGVGSLGEAGDVGGGVGGEVGSSKSRLVVGVSGSVPVSSPSLGHIGIHGAGRLEESVRVNEGVLSDEGVGVGLASGLRSAEGMDGIGKSINGIGVVEGLGTKHLEKKGVADKGRTVVNVLVRLDNPHKLLHGVVEVELDLVGRGTHRLVASELELSDEILVGVLGHTATLVGVKEDIIDIEGGGNQGLVVGNGGRHGLTGGTLGRGVDGTSLARLSITVEGSHSPQALVNRADVKVNLDLVVLEGNEGEGKTGVGAVPELEGHVKGGLGEGVTGGTHLAGSLGVARSVNISERGVGDEGELGGVSNHLEVTSLLLGSHGELVPDVHPITILTVNALTTNLDLNLSDDLLSGEVQPTGIDTGGSSSAGVGTDTHELVDLGESHLKVGAVSKITIAADRALDTTTEIGLSVEGLFNSLNGKVGVASVSHLPEGDLRITSKVYVLSAVSD